MDDLLIKRERIGAIERMERQLEQLRSKRQSLWRDLSEAQHNLFLVTKRRDAAMERYRKLQEAIAAETQNSTEINQLERQLKKARETFERDYPPNEE